MTTQKILPKTCAEALKIGSTRYFTGEPCTHGHVAERMTRTHGCVECLKLRTKRYRQGRKEELDGAIYRHNQKIAALLE